jgi:eukaryotic-like serine/threonine-protein kinase
MLVSEPDGGDRVKVLDFGIARIAPPSENRDATKLTRVGVVMGTVAYMSPEQATGQAIDERADLYSLGVMLYEMVAGVVPFDAELPSQVLARQLVEAPPPLPAGTAPALAELVYELMEKKPDQRPASAEAVLARLIALTPTPSGRVPAPKKAIPRRVVYAVGAGALCVGVLAVLLSGKHGDSAVPSAEPSAASAPSNVEATASAPAVAVPPAVSASSVPTATAPATAPVEPPAKPTPKSPSSKPSKSSTKAKTASAPAPTPESHAAPPPPPKRHTGPGGIYIPPPSEWFKN